MNGIDGYCFRWTKTSQTPTSSDTSFPEILLPIPPPQDLDCLADHH